MRKTIKALVLILLSTSCLQAQTTFKVVGGDVVVKGSPTLKLKDTRWVNDGDFSADQGTVTFSGLNSDTIGGSSATTFHRLLVDKNTAELVLGINTQVNDALEFLTGNLNLNGFDLGLNAPNGNLLGESETNRVLDSLGGELYTQLAINNVSTLNPGNIGLAISSTDNLGLTEIRRGHIAFNNLLGSQSSIGRYFEVIPSNSGATASLRFYYFDIENANSLVESSLQLFNSTDGGLTWTAVGKRNQDVGANWVEITDVDPEGLWTLGSCLGGSISPDLPSLPDLTGECIVNVSATPTASDACGGSLVGTTTDPLSYTVQGNYVIIWTYDDGNGNTNTQTQNVIISDNTAPQADIPVLSDAISECGINLTPPTATDNCAGSIVATTTDPLSYSVQGNYVVNWTYDDGNGNISTQTQNVIIDDNTAPVPDVSILADATAECGLTLTAPTATDNCAGSIIGTTTDPLSYNTVGNYVVNWTYDDGYGNSFSQTQNVVINDNTAPVPDISILADATAECGLILAAPTATDNCAGSIVATTTDPLIYNTVGNYVVSWTYDDGNGNSSTQTQNVIVSDNTDPVPDILVLADITAECGVSLAAPTATDNCAGIITATTSDPLSYNAQGSYVVNWTYDDGNGNSVTQIQFVIVDDNSAPLADVSVLADATADCGLTLSAPTATDNCSGPITATTTDPLSYNVQGTYLVTWTYDDGNGNTSSQTQNVIIDDNTAPVPDVPVLADATGECSLNLTAPTATDNCLGTITATTTDPLIYNTVGSYQVTWVFDDGNGNSSTQTQNVVIEDNTAPVPDVAILADATAECSLTLTAPTATDNCLGTVTATTNDPLSYSTEGNYTVTWTYDDGNGNIATQTQTVVINDLNAPVADMISLPVVNGACSATVSTVPTATDNCDGIIQGTTLDPLFYDQQGVYTITWLFEDGNGNNSAQTQTVIIDEANPDATSPFTWYLDADGDGYGDPNNSVVSCEAPFGFVLDGTDCNDMQALSFPGNAELCDGIDNDCDGVIDGGAVCPVYCQASGQSTQYEWIDQIKLGTINNLSGNDNGYGDYTAMSTDLEIGRSTGIELKPGFANGKYREYWRVWIDLNQDGDFDDAGEKLVQVKSKNKVKTFLTIPATANSGLTQMRIAMRYNGWAGPCQQFPLGEVEDYTVNLVVPTCNPLPANWANTDIGNPAIPGTACYDANNQSFTVSSSGNDIYGTQDEFQFAYTDLCGNGEIIARVSDITPISKFSLAGIMLRESFDEGSANVSMLKRPNGGTYYQTRFSTNGYTAAALCPGVLPGWVKISRTGDTFVGFVSSDGVNWTPTYTSTVAMGNCVKVGLAVSSFNTAGVNTSILDQVQVNSFPASRMSDPSENVTALEEQGNSPLVREENEASTEEALQSELTNEELKVYPNPANSKAFVELSALAEQSGTLQIYTMTGALVSQQQKEQM